MSKNGFEYLISLLENIPSIKGTISYGVYTTNRWWVKFSIDIANPLAWRIVQEFGHILNYISVEERLPTSFYPVSPPPYMNGGPENFLSWIIENRDDEFTPELVAEWLESRLPSPIGDPLSWED